MAGLEAKLGTLAGGAQRPAWPGRIVLATALAACAGLPILLLLPGADEDFILGVTVGAAVLAGVGVLGTARALDQHSSTDLLGRAIAVTATAALAGFSLWYGGDYFDDSFFISVLGFLLAILSGVLFVWFVHGVHRGLRPQARPVFLLAGFVSAGLGLLWTDQAVTMILAVTIPALLVAVEILR